jgi:hypothetical protein
MNLTDLIRNLETQLKTAEKYSKQYDSQATAIRKKLSTVAAIVGEKLVEYSSATASTIRNAAEGLSDTGRAKIIAAQRKRWAAYRKKTGKSTKKSSAKSNGNGKITSAGRAKIIAAQRKRWAAYRAKNAANGVKKSVKKVTSKASKKGSKLSAAGRAKIIAAQRKRWAAHKRS